MKKVKPRKTHTKLGTTTYEVDFTGPDGKRRRESFQEKIHAQDRCDEINGMSVAAWNAPEQLRLEAVHCNGLLDGTGLSLTAAVEFAIKHSAIFQKSPTIAELVAEHLHDKRKIRPPSLKDLRLRLGTFAERFGDRRLHEVTDDDLSEWMDEMETDGIGDLTIRNYLKKASQLFNYYLGKHCDKNPVDQVAVPKGGEAREVEYFNADEAAKILAASDVIGTRWQTVLGIFCGIRPNELVRLSEYQRTHGTRLVQKSADELVIRLPATVTKMSQARVVELRRGDPLGDAVLDWLAGPVPSQIVVNIRPERLADEAKVEWVYDGLRHTAATMHVAKYNDPVRTAFLLGHSKPTTLQRHYRGLADRKEADAFYALRPPVAPSVDAG